MWSGVLQPAVKAAATATIAKAMRGLSMIGA
jgi:hypothetical protein